MSQKPLIQPCWDKQEATIVDDLLAINAWAMKSRGFGIHEAFCSYSMWERIVSNPQAEKVTGPDELPYFPKARPGPSTEMVAILKAVPFLTFRVDLCNDLGEFVVFMVNGCPIPFRVIW